MGGEPSDQERRAGSVEALRALAHPLRLRMWSAMAAGPVSAAALARALGIEHASASYHLRVLRRAGLVVLAEERKVNGGIERRHRQVETPAEPVGDEPVTTEDWVALVTALGALLQSRAASVSPEAKWFVDLELWVDPVDITRLRRRLDDVLAELRVAAVDPTTPGARRVSASAVLFEMDTEADGAR